MATIINTPTPIVKERNSGIGLLLGVLLVVCFLLFFFVYGIPAISNSIRTPSVNIPDKININVQTPGK